MRNDIEHAHQKKVVSWARNTGILQYPELKWLYAIPNGGHRLLKVAMKMKAEGVTRGVSDLCLPVPRGHYHGLYLEMKAPHKKPTAEQNGFLHDMRLTGYMAEYKDHWREAINFLIYYLRLGAFMPLLGPETTEDTMRIKGELGEKETRQDND